MGGAQRTAAEIQSSRSRSPSPARCETGLLEKPVRCSAAKRKSPERSPVKKRPVRFAPWAAGARPKTTTFASGSPKPGTGRPQYSSSAWAAFFSLATLSRHSTRRGHERQAVISASSAARRSLWRAGSFRRRSG